VVTCRRRLLSSAKQDALTRAVYRQEFLETTWPAHDAPPPKQSGDKTSAEKPAAEPQLNVTNTAIKWVLDQTWGAAFNTVLFSLFIHSVQQAMVRPGALSAPDQSVQYLVALARGDVAYAPVDWNDVLARTRAEFWPFVVAGWKLWPLVSVINFVFVKTVNGRNLVGSLAGVVWGIYLSLFGGK
jgi:hypothetical protein